MTAKFYKIIKLNGSVAIMQILDESTVEDEIAKWTEEQQAEVASFTEIQVSDIPTDRAFRDAWREKDGVICEDLECAKALKMEEFRKVRNAKLAQLDVDYIRADEKQDAQTKNIIAAKKIALRNLPTEEKFEEIKTVEQLKAYVPKILT